MLNDHELEDLLCDLESDRIERKESAADGEKIRQTICAFANDMPGHQSPGLIFIGAKDDGSCAELEITDSLLLRLSDMRSDGNILPLPTMSVHKRIVHHCALAVIVVEPSLFPPVRFKGRVWIRVGSQRAIASAEEERRLNERRRATHLPWDLQPIAPATCDDLDLVLFERSYLPAAIAPDILAENERTVRQQLASLRFISVDQTIPTVVGLLAIGKSPDDFIPGGYVQFLRIDGTSLSDPILDQKVCHGPLPDMVRTVDNILAAHIRVATDITSEAVEKRHPDYPIPALQQIVRNAVMHRDYETSNAPTRITWFSDRIEVQNPGGPFGQVSRENFGQPGVTDYRNPNVAEAMRVLGFVQRFGVGIQVARRQLSDNGNPEPLFQVEPSFVRVTIGGSAGLHSR